MSQRRQRVCEPVRPRAVKSIGAAPPAMSIRAPEPTKFGRLAAPTRVRDRSRACPRTGVPQAASGGRPGAVFHDLEDPSSSTRGAIGLDRAVGDRRVHGC